MGARVIIEYWNKKCFPWSSQTKWILQFAIISPNKHIVTPLQAPNYYFPQQMLSFFPQKNWENFGFFFLGSVNLTKFANILGEKITKNSISQHGDLNN